MLKPHPHRTPWQNAIVILTGTVVTCVLVTALQWGRPVLIPIALAILLTFLLNPVVKKLQKLGFGRLPAVMLSVCAAGLSILLIGGLVTKQVTILVTELPQNTNNIKARVNTLRQLGSSAFARQFQQMAAEISSDVEASTAEQPPQTVAIESSSGNTVVVEPVVLTPKSTPWRSLTGYLGSALEVLGTLAFTLILLIVFLFGRDDLRDRVVVLSGKARIAMTSKALEDVTERISRYLLMVAALNGGYGVLMALGLLALQVPYAFLWGFLAGSLRFIPYLGPWVGAMGPIGIALATSASDEWFQPLAVFGFIVVLELVSNNILEPLVFGRSTGVSSTALIISAAFWFFLWGPIGLVLSAPIAVCLMVLGRNIPQLSFLDMLLGSEPAFRSDMGIYQRFMLGDEHEATRLLLLRLKDTPADEVCDELLIPTLNYAKRDRLKDQLSEADHKEVLDGVQISLKQISKQLRAQAEPEANEPNGSPQTANMARPVDEPRVRILLCPAADKSDSVALDMLGHLLNPDLWDVEQTSEETLTSELTARIALDPPAIICIAALPPRGLTHARYLCKRLQDSSPQLQIVVGRWGQKRNGRIEREQLEDVGAGFVTTSLVETCKLLTSRLPLLKQEDAVATHVRILKPAEAVIAAGH